MPDERCSGDVSAETFCAHAGAVRARESITPAAHRLIVAAISEACRDQLAIGAVLLILMS